MCYEPSRRAVGFTAVVAVLLERPLSLAWEHSLDELQPGEQPPDEPGFQHAAHSRVWPLPVDVAHSPDVGLLLAARPADVKQLLDAKRSRCEAQLPGVEHFGVEACFRSERRSLPDVVCSPDEAHSPSPVRSVDEARCSPTGQVASLPEVELPHSCLQAYKVLLLV